MKRSAIACKVPTSKPTRRQYDHCRALVIPFLEDYEYELFTRRKSKAAADQLPAPHMWPSYGGRCRNQAFEEMSSFQALAMAYRLWLFISSTTNGYAPPKEVVDAVLVSFTAAKLNYSLAWQAMEDCLTGAVV